MAKTFYRFLSPFHFRYTKMCGIDFSAWKPRYGLRFEALKLQQEIVAKCAAFRDKQQAVAAVAAAAKKADNNNNLMKKDAANVNAKTELDDQKKA